MHNKNNKKLPKDYYQYKLISACWSEDMYQNIDQVNKKLLVDILYLLAIIFNHFDNEIHAIIYRKSLPSKENYMTNEGYYLLVPNEIIPFKINNFDPWMKPFCKGFYKKNSYLILKHISKKMDITFEGKKDIFNFDIALHKKINRSNVLIKRMKFIQIRKCDSVIYLSLRNSKKNYYHSNYLFYDSHNDYWIRLDPTCFAYTTSSIYFDKIMTKNMGNKKYKSPDVMMPAVQNLYPKPWCLIFATIMMELYAQHRNIIKVNLKLYDQNFLSKKIRGYAKICKSIQISKKNISGIGGSSPNP